MELAVQLQAKSISKHNVYPENPQQNGVWHWRKREKKSAPTEREQEIALLVKQEIAHMRLDENGVKSLDTKRIIFP